MDDDEIPMEEEEEQTEKVRVPVVPTSQRVNFGYSRGAREDAARAWIEKALGERVGQCTLQQELKDGVVLCNLMNVVRPGS